MVCITPVPSEHVAGCIVLTLAPINDGEQRTDVEVSARTVHRRPDPPDAGIKHLAVLLHDLALLQLVQRRVIPGKHSADDMLRRYGITADDRIEQIEVRRDEVVQRVFRCNMKMKQPARAPIKRL